MKTGVIGAYQAGNSLIHKLDPRAKIVISFALMIVIFFLDTWQALAIYALATLTVVLLSRVKLKTVFSALKPILFILCFAFIINIFTISGTVIWQWGFLSISREGLEQAILVSLRLILLTMQSSVLITFTTSSLAIADALESLLKPLKIFHVPVDDFALMISIALRFVPTLAEEAEKIMKAQSARGANFDTGSFMDKAKGALTILVPLFVNAIKRADDLALALEARGYASNTQKTKYKPLHLTTKDIVFASIVLVIVVLILVLNYL